MVVSGPWPGTTTVSSGSLNNVSRIECRICSREPPEKSVRPDASLKQGVTGEQERRLARRFDEHAYRAGGVSRRMQHASLQLAEGQYFAAGKDL